MRRSGGDGDQSVFLSDEINRELPAGAFASHLGLQVAGFAAGTAIVNAVFTEPGIIQALA